MTTVVVAGAIANRHRYGGSAWVRMSWAEGLRRLGFDVVFVERLAAVACVDDAGRPARFETCASGAAFEAAIAQIGLTGSAALISPDGRSSRGMQRAELVERITGADLLVNLSGHLRSARLLRRIRRRAYVDLDPGYTQIWHAQGAELGLESHDLHFTVGANVGTRRCPLPTGGFAWRPIRQPIVLDRWPVAGGGFSGFTTVASWRGAFGRVAWRGTTYGLKAHEFRRLADLPRATGLPFEAALELHPADAEDRTRLSEGGWRLIDPGAVATARRFADYVRGSGAEFSAAQGVYVETSSGWFSDRTVRYLASGRPAVVQDTGLSGALAAGEGVLTFRTPAEASLRVCEVAADHARHAKAARRLAEEWFSAERALAPLLEAAGVAP